MKKYLVIFVLAAMAFSSGCVSIKIPLYSAPAPLEDVIVRPGNEDTKVLIVDVDGVISSSREGGLLSGFKTTVAVLKERLVMAREDKYVKAIVLRVNSPGGGVTASDIIYKELKRFRKETGIPIIACFMDVAASGGYYVSMAADKIVCHPTGVTGSIGVIAQLYSVETLLGKVGIEPITIKSSEHKDIGSPLRTPTGAERVLMQKLVDDMYNRFVGIVAQGRGLTIEDVRNLADGRVYAATEALKLGLIDKIGYLDDAIEMAQEAAEIEGAAVVMYSRPGEYRNNIYSAQAGSKQNPVSALTDQLMPGLGARFYYLWLPGR